MHLQYDGWAMCSVRWGRERGRPLGGAAKRRGALWELRRLSARLPVGSFKLPIQRERASVPDNLVETNGAGNAAVLPCQWPFPISRMGSSVLQTDDGTMRSDMQLLILIDRPARVSYLPRCTARACALAPLPTSSAPTPSSTARRYLAVPKRRVQLQRGGSHIAC